MTENRKLVKTFLLCAIVILIIAIGFCSVFIARANTERLLFG